ncbi:MAG: hypothetical protein H9847_10585 [Candidatus Anaerobiospirillum pullicola]|uniref:Uncharacterized protein n=1 Tax=Candidatus Anaerobiospirillum pullicola TaxID=2838451 RepID=A0A948TIH1_9GAMM|nr:hypothetical protein [Candidatus Anaerobiospirillum pullicola]
MDRKRRKEQARTGMATLISISGEGVVPRLRRSNCSGKLREMMGLQRRIYRGGYGGSSPPAKRTQPQADSGLKGNQQEKAGNDSNRRMKKKKKKKTRISITITAAKMFLLQ